MPHAFIRYYHKISQQPVEDTSGPFPCEMSDIATESAFRKWAARCGCGPLGRASRTAKFRVEDNGNKAVFFFPQGQAGYHSIVATISEAIDKTEFLALTEPGKWNGSQNVEYLLGLSTGKYRIKPSER